MLINSHRQYHISEYSVPSEYDHQLDPSQIILFKDTIEFRKLSGSSREWSYSEGTLYRILLTTVGQIIFFSFPI